MPAPIYVRSLTEKEEEALAEARESGVAFTRRRAQIVWLSSRGTRSGEIAERVGCTAQTVRNAIHEFNEEGLESLSPEQRGPSDPERIFDAEARQELKRLAHQSPREFSQGRSRWTLELLAEVACEEGITGRVVSHETIRKAILEMGSTWPRAKQWVQKPDPTYLLNRKARGA